jgi:hypothetical protein
MGKTKNQKKEEKYTIPREQITKDLFKTFMFAAFALWVLLALYFAGIDFQDALNFLTFR